MTPRVESSVLDPSLEMGKGMGGCKGWQIGLPVWRSRSAVAVVEAEGERSQGSQIQTAKLPLQRLGTGDNPIHNLKRCRCADLAQAVPDQVAEVLERTGGGQV